VSTISFIIPTYNSLEDLRLYLDSFLKYNSPDNIFFQIIDTSRDNELLIVEREYFGKLHIKVHFVENRGYAFACNYGYEYAPESSIFIFSNPDILFLSNIVDSIREAFNENTYGTVIQKNRHLAKCTFDLYPQYKNFITEILFFKKPLNWIGWYNPKFISISGAFMIIGRNVIKENGLFDHNYFLYYEEDDYFYRLRNNTKFRIIRNKYVIHNISASVDKNLDINKFRIRADSLYYYSQKFGNFTYFKSLITLYKIFSPFISRHKERLMFLREKVTKI
jgi:GT2 family glycosyltransferase